MSGSDGTTRSKLLWSEGMVRTIAGELKTHAPFTILGAGTGIVIMAVLALTRAPRPLSTTLFWSFHPLHVLLSDILIEEVTPIAVEVLLDRRDMK
jgi:hypothetical protein